MSELTHLQESVDYLGYPNSWCNQMASCTEDLNAVTCITCLENFMEQSFRVQARLNVLKPSARKRVKKEKIEDALRRSDLTAQTVGRDDIEYGHHESLPRGEHVARIKNEE